MSIGVPGCGAQRQQPLVDADRRTCLDGIRDRAAKIGGLRAELVRLKKNSQTWVGVRGPSQGNKNHGLFARDQLSQNRRFFFAFARQPNVGNEQLWRFFHPVNRLRIRVIAIPGFDDEAVLKLDLVEHRNGEKEVDGGPFRGRLASHAAACPNARRSPSRKLLA